MNDIINNKTAYNLLLKNWFQYEAGFKAMHNLFYHGLVKSSHIDCFVNLNQYLSPLYKRNDYQIDEQFSIAASIINFCAHISYFFQTRFNMDTSIYLVYGSYAPYYAVTELDDASYNAHNITEINSRPEVTEAINLNLGILDIIIQYIPGVYYLLDPTCEPITAIRRIIKYNSLKGIKYPRLLFSKEYYDLQLIATTPNTHMVRVKKTINGDQTFTVSYYNFYSMLTRIKKLKNPIGKGMSPELYSLYLAFMGCNDRNIHAIYNANTTDKIIHNCIESGMLLNGYDVTIMASNFTIRDIMFNEGLDGTIAHEVINRFKALDTIYQSMDHDNTTPLCPNVLLDSYDPEGVKQIAQQYFVKYPLDLNVF